MSKNILKSKLAKLAPAYRNGTYGPPPKPITCLPAIGGMTLTLTTLTLTTLTLTTLTLHDDADDTDDAVFRRFFEQTFAPATGLFESDEDSPAKLLPKPAPPTASAEERAVHLAHLKGVGRVMLSRHHHHHHH